jgi:hypothetical protein
MGLPRACLTVSKSQILRRAPCEERPSIQWLLPNSPGDQFKGRITTCIFVHHISLVNDTCWKDIDKQWGFQNWPKTWPLTNKCACAQTYSL